jgi:hypothetical protein
MAPQSFIITNNGGDMTVAYIYTVTDIYGNIIQKSTPFQLTAGQSLTHDVEWCYHRSDIVHHQCGQPDGSEASMANCHEPIPAIAPGSTLPFVSNVWCSTPSVTRTLKSIVWMELKDRKASSFTISPKDESVDSRPSRAPNDSNVVFQSEP